MEMERSFSFILIPDMVVILDNGNWYEMFKIYELHNCGEEDFEFD